MFMFYIDVGTMRFNLCADCAMPIMSQICKLIINTNTHTHRHTRTHDQICLYVFPIPFNSHLPIENDNLLSSKVGKVFSLQYSKCVGKMILFYSMAIVDKVELKLNWIFHSFIFHFDSTFHHCPKHLSFSNSHLLSFE